MNSNMHFASLDIVTNSVVLLIIRRDADGVLSEVTECFETTRLGAGVDKTGNLDPAAVARTLSALETCMAFARDSVPLPLHWAVAATSAVRDARNSPIFLEPCRRICGCEPLVMTGEQEAEAAYAGAVSDLPTTGYYLTMDVGGGSTELAVGRGDDCLFSCSLDMGCVRFGERFGLLEGPLPEAEPDARKAVGDLLSAALGRLRESLPVPVVENLEVVASGGTATSFAAVAQSLPVYDREKVHGFAATRKELDSQARRFLQMSLRERSCFPGLREGRGRVLPTGLLILSECLNVLDKDRFRITTRGLRFGLACLMAEGKMSPAAIWK